MNKLLQVGATTWVDPDDIRAVEWAAYGDCPRIYLGGTVRVSATKFKREGNETAEELTDALIASIAQAMRKPTPPRFSGRSA